MEDHVIEPLRTTSGMWHLKDSKSTQLSKWNDKSCHRMVSGTLEGMDEDKARR